MIGNSQRRLGLILLAAWTGTVSVAAAQIQPGRIYKGGETISDPESGLQLTLPGGWRGGLSPDGESFLLESESGGAHMVVIADELAEAEARQHLLEPMDLGGGVTLTPDGPIREVASGHLSADYSVKGAAADLLGTVDVRLTQTGLGVAFILLSPPDAAPAHREAMRELAFSLGVGERQAPAATTGSGNDQWEPYLRGMYMARYFTRTGYTESTELWLCSNGTFSYDSQGGGFGGGASGAAQGRGQGRWTATGAGATGTLILKWSSGGQTTLNLRYDYQQERLYVNDQRWLRGKNEYCS